MGKPHPVELRERVITYVDEGYCHREAARHFRVLSLPQRSGPTRIKTTERAGLKPLPLSVNVEMKTSVGHNVASLPLRNQLERPLWGILWGFSK